LPRKAPSSLREFAIAWNLTSGNLHTISSASDTSKFAKRLKPTAFLDSTRDALRHIIERAVARGKARKEPSLLPRIGMANDAVDKVRRGEPKRLLKDGDDRLKGSEYFWLTSLENHSEKQHARFQSICNLTLATGRAWSYKELLRDLWAQETEGDKKTCAEFEGSHRYHGDLRHAWDHQAVAVN
jgi:hypothetical protein